MKTSPSPWALRLVPLALAAALPAAARAELLVYEPFDYPAGLTLNANPASGFNLTGLWDDPSITGFKLAAGSPGLTYGSLLGPLPAASGNRLTQAVGTTPGNSTVAIGDDVLVAAGETIYFSALFTFDDSSNGNHLAQVALLDESTGHSLTFGERAVGVRGLGVESNALATGGAHSAAGADNAFSDGQTLWLIGRYTNGAAAGGDSIDLVGYDTAASQSIAPSFDLADPSAQFAYSLTGVDLDLAQISAIRFTIRGTANNHIDELRIGETYADVALPAPGAAVTLAAACVGLLYRRRRP